MELKSNIQTTKTEILTKQEPQVSENEQQSSSSTNQNIIVSKEVQQNQQISLENSNQYDPNAFLQDYLKTEQKLYLQYLEEDYSREFKFNEYVQWRTQKPNQFKNKISNYHKLITEKYIYETFMFNKEGDVSITFNGYNQFIPICIHEYPYISFYLFDVEKNNWEVSDYNYRCYENQYRSRLVLIESIRSIVREGSEYTYSENVFNQYVSSETQISAEGYKSFFNQWQQLEEQTKVLEEQRIKDLIASIENINLFVFQDYKLQCENFGLVPTKEGYIDYESKAKTTFSETYLNELNQDLIEQRQQQTQKGVEVQNKGHKLIVNDLNEDQQQFLQVVQQKQVRDQQEVDVETKIIQSSSCQCCKGKPYDCEAQACLLLGNCICISQF